MFANILWLAGPCNQIPYLVQSAQDGRGTTSKEASSSLHRLPELPESQIQGKIQMANHVEPITHAFLVP
jgi:hypothetical protein